MPGDIWTTSSDPDCHKTLEFVFVDNKITVTHVHHRNREIGPAISYWLVELQGQKTGIAMEIRHSDPAGTHGHDERLDFHNVYDSALEDLRRSDGRAYVLISEKK